MLKSATLRPAAPAPALGRVAIACHAHPSISKGGAEIAAYTLFTGLLSLGVDAIFIAACAREDRSRLCLGSPREFAVFHATPLYDHFYHLASPAVVAQLASILTDARIDLVNFHHFYRLGINAVRRIARQPGMRTVVTLHEFLPMCHNHGQMITRPGRMLCERATSAACVTCFPEHTRAQFTLRRDLFLAAFANASRFISPSRFLADRFTAWGLPPDRMDVVENGLAHLPSAAPPRRPEAQDNWVFGFFGQINPFKGVDTILAAVPLIAQKKSLAARIRIRLHGNIVGQAESFTSRLADLLQKHEFLSQHGPYDNAAVARLMAECDYVLVPSSWWENSPVVIQEAFAAGRPVICTGIGGMAEKVHDNVSGLHFRLGDAADLVRILEHAAGADMHRRLCTGLPRPVDAAAMARAYLDIFTAIGATRPAEARGLARDVA